MSATDRYFTVPLSIVHAGESELDVLEACVLVGIVNAGIGYAKRHGADAFAALLDEAKQKALASGTNCTTPITYRGKSHYWNCALVGSHFLGINDCNHASAVGHWETWQRQGEVYFRIRSDWLWNAVYEARRNAGADVTYDGPPLSFREFRIIVAILSAKVNRQGFTFLGWESIQARACGFKSKAEFATGIPGLPDHCQPLSRQVIRDTLERLEPLGFFARFRHSNGPSGGLMAYSFRHTPRDLLAEAVGKWREEKRQFKDRVAANRAKDRVLSAAQQAGTKSEPTENQHKEGAGKNDQFRNQVENPLILR